MPNYCSPLIVRKVLLRALFSNTCTVNNNGRDSSTQRLEPTALNSKARNENDPSDRPTIWSHSGCATESKNRLRDTWYSSACLWVRYLFCKINIESYDCNCRGLCWKASKTIFTYYCLFRRSCIIYRDYLHATDYWFIWRRFSDCADYRTSNGIILTFPDGILSPIWKL